MSQILLEDGEVQEIFKSHLRIEFKVMSIESLFANIRMQSKIIYDPYYQRNYVWDNDKASYFVESILLGTEIPPLVFFNSGKSIEVIDGRQRFETIKRFLNNSFHLTDRGLYMLKNLSNKHFEDLQVEIKDIFWDTKLRIIEFGIINEPRLDERREDLIKKEIFKRYNSGITPLKNAEIEKAFYIYDDLTTYFKKQLKANKNYYQSILELFFVERDLELINDSLTIERVMQKIRMLLVLHKIPIKYYSTLNGRKEVVEKLFENLSNNVESIGEQFDEFISKISLLKEIRALFIEKGLPYTRLMFECLFWAISILQDENIDVEYLNDSNNLEKLVSYLAENVHKYNTVNSHFYKEFIERYATTAAFFESEFSINFSIYMASSNEFRKKFKELKNDDKKTESLFQLESYRLNKTDASTTTIEDICRQMNRERFLLRPPYQRGEAINKIKSSAIIESILLGIKLPPIFVYRRKDGVSEVVDGQQRLLSILGFIGREFINEDGKKLLSKKHKFSLSNKLTILKDIQGKQFEDLSDDLKDKIYDFNLSLVTIDAKVNENFDPVDLFLRLNNKPYPIMPNTFEMWNSYVDKDIISATKDNTKKHTEWFYSRINNRRMENEELYLSLAYLDYMHSLLKNNTHMTTSEFLDMYQRGNNINFRIKDKADITKVLDDVSTDEDRKACFIKQIKNVESFIKKVKFLLTDKDIEDEQKLHIHLKEELNEIFGVKGRNQSRRTLQSFYALWYILSGLNSEMIRSQRLLIKDELKLLFNYMKNVPISESEQDYVNIFKTNVQEFWNKYKPQQRSVFLSKEEKQNLLKSQNNRCPLCQGVLFISDDIEVDHIKPLAIGGRDGFLNLQLTHKECNRKKGASFK